MSIVRFTDWMSGRWWAASAVALAFIVVMRTGTVGAPAEARAPLDGLRGGSSSGALVEPGWTPLADAAEQVVPLSPATGRQLSEARILALEAQLARAEQRVLVERERSELIRASHDRLDSELARLSQRVRRELGVELGPVGEGTAQTAAAATSLTVDAPVPIEALFIRRTNQ